MKRREKKRSYATATANGRIQHLESADISKHRDKQT
jgi:hypothetical protein